MVENLIKEAEKKMASAVDHLKDELTKIRTGRANASLVEDIRVAYYGATMSLKEVATITVPEPSLIQIKPFDRGSIGDIESAIRNSDIGLNPINDGNFVRLNIPALNEERRIELARQIKRVGEEVKVAIRNSRGDAWSKTQELEKKGDATEDDKFRAEKRLNELTEKINGEVDKIVSAKEAEIMKI